MTVYRSVLLFDMESKKMIFFTPNVARRFNIKTDIQLTTHNLNVLYKCRRGERYRVRHGILNGRNVVIVHTANNWWDKFMSYLPSGSSLRKRFVSQLYQHAHDNEDIRSRLGYMGSIDVNMPFLSGTGVRNIIARTAE